MAGDSKANNWLEDAAAAVVTIAETAVDISIVPITESVKQISPAWKQGHETIVESSLATANAADTALNGATGVIGGALSLFGMNKSAAASASAWVYVGLGVVVLLVVGGVVWLFRGGKS